MTLHNDYQIFLTCLICYIKNKRVMVIKTVFNEYKFHIPIYLFSHLLLYADFLELHFVAMVGNFVLLRSNQMICILLHKPNLYVRVKKIS